MFKLFIFLLIVYYIDEINKILIYIVYQIFSEKINIESSPKIDTTNPNYKKNGGNVKVS